MLFASLFLAFSASAGEEPTLPEFECTAIEIRDSKSAARILGSKKYPALSLRAYASGEWQLAIKGGLNRLPATGVSKVASLTEKKVTYEISSNGTSLRVDLTGTSPSRQGTFWETKPSPAKPKLVAGLTCH